jgi:hypothetical protein
MLGPIRLLRSLRLPPAVMVALAALAAGCASASAAGERHLFVMEYPNRIVEMVGSRVVWEHRTPSPAVTFTVLPNGDVFYPHGAPSPGAQRVDRDHKVVWSFTSHARELLGGDWTPEGNAILGEGGPPAAVEVGPAMTVLRSMPVATTSAVAHRQIRHIRKLASGNILVALEAEGAVREIDPSGRTVWQFGDVRSVHDAVRLPNGRTLIGGGQSKKVIEVDAQGRVTWQFGEDDAPALGLAWICSVQVLRNGNLLVDNWLGHDGGTGVHAFEVTRDKRVVWTLDDHRQIKSATTVVAVGE